MEMKNNPETDSFGAPKPKDSGFELPTASDVMGRFKKTFELIKNHAVPLVVMPLVILLIIQFAAPIILSFALGDSAGFGLAQMVPPEGAPNSVYVGSSEADVQNSLISFGTGFIVILALYIIGGIFLALVPAYNISAIYHGRKTDWGSAFGYAKNNIGRYFSVLWHSFLYVLLIPIAILLGALFITIAVPMLGAILSIVGVIVLIYFLVVRGFRIFAILYIAVDENLSGKQALEKSKQITHKKLGDVFINMLALGVLAFVINFAFSSLFDSVLGSMVNSYSLNELLDAVRNPLSLINIVAHIFSIIEGTIGIAIGAPFTYMLFKALEKLKKENPVKPQNEQVSPA